MGYDTHAHPIWASRSPAQTIDLQSPAGMTRVTLALLVAFLGGIRQAVNTARNDRLTFLRSRQVLVSGGFFQLMQGWRDQEGTNQQPPLPAEVGRGRSRDILLDVAREPVLCESAASAGLSEAVRRSGVVLVDGVSGEGE